MPNNKHDWKHSEGDSGGSTENATTAGAAATRGSLAEAAKPTPSPQVAVVSAGSERARGRYRTSTSNSANQQHGSARVIKRPVGARGGIWSRLEI